MTQDMRGGVDGEVNGIWRQCLRDILRVCPKSTQGSYCTLGMEELESVTEDMYKGTKLPFTKAFVKLATGPTWGTFFDRFFPTKAMITAAQSKGPTQHWGSCGYHHRWIQLMDKLSGGADHKVRESLRGEFDKLVWLPWGKADRMWVASSTETGHHAKLPAGANGTAVKIALNPRGGKRIGEMRI